MTCDLRHLIQYYCETIRFRLCVYKWAPIYLAIVYAMLVRQWSRTSVGCKSLHFAYYNTANTRRSTCTKTTLDQRLEFAEKSRRDALELLRHWGNEGVDRMIIAKLTPLWASGCYNDSTCINSKKPWRFLVEIGVFAGTGNQLTDRVSSPALVWALSPDYEVN